MRVCCVQPADVSAVMSGVAERTRSVGFEVVLLFRHYVRRTPVTGASTAAGCQLFVAAGAAPLGASPEAMQLRAVACRASPLKMLVSVTLHDHPVLHEPVSVYTGALPPPTQPPVTGASSRGACPQTFGHTALVAYSAALLSLWPQAVIVGHGIHGCGLHLQGGLSHPGAVNW